MKKVSLLALSLSFLIVMLPVCFADTLNLVYDRNGNLVTGDGFYREYNSFNQLHTVRNGSDVSGALLQEFTYHPTEERVLVKKSYNSSGEVYETVYYVSDELVRVVNNSGSFDTVYVSHEGQRVAELRPDGSKIFVHSDHLGSTSVITDEAGNVLENTSYTPYGVILEGGDESRYQYEGKEFDSVTGQYDFHFRGYKAEWGLFTQPDTLLPNVYDPQQLNRYMFERGNPWKYTDETGHDKEGGGYAQPGNWADLIGLVSRLLATWLGREESNKAAEETRYANIYKEYQKEHPDLPEDPYMNVYVYGGMASMTVVRHRRESLDKLEKWQEKKIKDMYPNTMHAADYYSTQIQPTSTFDYININLNIIKYSFTYIIGGEVGTTSGYSIDLGDDFNNVVPVLNDDGEIVWVPEDDAPTSPLSHNR